MAHTCYYCGDPAPYDCDAVVREPDKKCGRHVCDNHATPRREGQMDLGADTLCEDHAQLQIAKVKRKAATQQQEQKQQHDGPALYSGHRGKPLTPPTPLDLDGETYELLYDFNAICKAEEYAQANLIQGIALFLIDIANARQVRGLLHAALMRYHPKLTLEDAGALIRIDTMAEIRTALLLAYNEAMPEDKRMVRPSRAGAQHDENGTPAAAAARADETTTNPSVIGNSGSAIGPSGESASV